MSEQFKFNSEDFIKSAKVFVWNALSFSATIAIALTAVPSDQLPPCLVWIGTGAAAINAVAYATLRWLQDNSKK